MADNNAPPMSLAASGNMTMSMSTSSGVSKKFSAMSMDSPISKQDTLESASMKPDLVKPKSSQHVEANSTNQALTGSQKIADTQQDRMRSREKAFNMQRIQLAEQLSNEHNLRMALEARIAALQDELASLRTSNANFQVERARIHERIDEANQQLATQTTEAGQRDSAIMERVRDLESKLEEAARLIKHHETRIEDDKTAIKEALGKLRDAEISISNMEKSHQARESDLQQRLSLKGIEAKRLKREMSTLQAACADAISKKEAKELKDQFLQEQQRLTDAHDRSLAESRQLRERLDDLQSKTEPFLQVVVICVDVSGSLGCVLHDVKQAYRDVLHMIRSNNNNARVSVVIHGTHGSNHAGTVQAITDATFNIVDSMSDEGGSEDYSYCLEQADNILSTYVDSKKLIILIGDGQALCRSTVALFATCEKLRSASIMAHVIVITSLWLHSTGDSTMQEIARITGGRIENKDTYLLAMDELLRHEREEYFKAS